jgi:hypothetical protein
MRDLRARTRGWRPEAPRRGHGGSEDGGGPRRAVGKMAGARAGGGEDGRGCGRWGGWQGLRAVIARRQNHRPVHAYNRDLRSSRE